MNKSNIHKKDRSKNNDDIKNKFSQGDKNITKRENYLHKRFKHINGLEEESETKKYIKEMQEMADKNEKKNNIIIAVTLSSFILICSFIGIKTLISKPEIAKKEVVINNNSNIKNINDNSDINTDKDSNKNISDLKKFNAKFYEYVTNQSNREKSLDEAKKLRGGNTGLTAFYISDLLKNNAVDIDTESNYNIEQLMKSLIDAGWTKNYNLKELEKGDICFTTNMADQEVPSHSYIFMGWKEDGNTDYATVCDGQVTVFSSTVHERNVGIEEDQREKFQFFMRK